MIEYKEAIGRRKTASARVRLYPGTGDIVVKARAAIRHCKEKSCED